MTQLLNPMELQQYTDNLHAAWPLQSLHIKRCAEGDLQVPGMLSQNTQKKLRAAFASVLTSNAQVTGAHHHQVQGCAWPAANVQQAPWGAENRFQVECVHQSKPLPRTPVVPVLPEAFSQEHGEHLRHCLESEQRYRAKSHVRAGAHNSTDVRKRLVLVDWLVEVVDEFQLSQDTLFQAVNFLDRFLAVRALPKHHLQLAGITCMWIAAKYQEVMVPSLDQFAEITDNSYSPDELIAMELQILTSLGWELSGPTTHSFLELFLDAASRQQQLLHMLQQRQGYSPAGAAAGYDARIAPLSCYILELVLLHPGHMDHLPSQLAAAAMCLSQRMLGAAGRSSGGAALLPGLLEALGVSVAQLSPLLDELTRLHTWACTAPSPPFIREKYARPAHQGVSCFTAATGTGGW